MPEVQISAEQSAPAMPTRDDVARSWGEVSSGRSPGRSAKKRQQQVQNLVRRMQAETRKESDGKIIGPLRPCTVVNFNPVELVVEGQLRITVPKPGTTSHHQIKMPYRGRMVQGHYCYIASPMVGERKSDKEPIYYTVVTGHEVDSVLPIDVPTVNARVFSPHSIACELWSQYNSPTFKLMGGILMFDQGPHVLAAQNLAKTGDRIFVPERLQMEDEGLYTYQLRETLLDDELDRIFDTQRQYCDVVIQQAHTLWAEQDVASRKMVTDTHREWARWAKAMGYLEQLPEWVNAKLILGDSIAELRVCRYCGTQQSSAIVFFCPKCNAPYDPYKAFMAGLHVPQGFLETLEGEELEAVLRTMQERKSRFATLGPQEPPTPPAAMAPAIGTEPKPKTEAQIKREQAKAAKNQQSEKPAEGETK